MGVNYFFFFENFFLVGTSTNVQRGVFTLSTTEKQKDLNSIIILVSKKLF